MASSIKGTQSSPASADRMSNLHNELQSLEQDWDIHRATTKWAGDGKDSLEALEERTLAIFSKMETIEYDRFQNDLPLMRRIHTDFANVSAGRQEAQQISEFLAIVNKHARDFSVGKPAKDVDTEEFVQNIEAWADQGRALLDSILKMPLGTISSVIDGLPERRHALREEYEKWLRESLTVEALGGVGGTYVNVKNSGRKTSTGDC
jgi:hypothetical protein